MAREKRRGNGSSQLIVRIALAYLLALSSSGHASVYCIVRETNQYQQSILSHRAQCLVAEGDKLMAMPAVNFVRLLNASTDWQNRGQLNYGVFEITDSEGKPIVLKIVDGEQFLVRNPESGLLVDFAGELSTQGFHLSSTAFKEYLDVHWLLGEIFVAPKLIAIFTSRQLKQAFRTHWSALKEASEKFEFDVAWIDRPRFGGSQAVGVVMQKLPVVPEQGMLHPISRPTSPNEFMVRWRPEDAIAAVRDIVEIRRRVLIAGVNVIDQQFVVTPSARAYLIDLDQARFEPLGPYMDVSYEILKLVDQWQTITGLQLDQQLKFDLLDEATRAHSLCTSDSDFCKLLSDWRCERLLESRG